MDGYSVSEPATVGGASWDGLGLLSSRKLPAWVWLKPSCSTSPGVRFPESCQDEVRDQKQLLKDAAAFLLSCQIPGLVREGLKGRVGAA